MPDSSLDVEALVRELHTLRLRVAELEAYARDCALTTNALHDSKHALARLRSIIDSLPDATFVVDRDKRVIAWNRALEEMTGVPKAEILGRGPQAYSTALYGEQRPILIDLIDAPSPEDEARYDFVDRRGTLYAEAFVPRLFGGRGAHVWITATPLNDEDGRFAGAIETVRDVTEYKRAQSQEQRLARAVEAAAEAVVLTDCEGQIEQVNPAFTRITGYSLDEVRGKTPRALRSGHHPLAFYEDMWATILRGQVYSGRVINKRKDGSLYHAALTIAPLNDPHRGVIGFVGVQRDVTAEIEHEKQLAAALEQAQAATRAKSEFLAKMSHELRTPLNAIIGFTELMIDDEHDPPGEKRARRLEKVQRNAKNLLALINDILDLSKVEAGRLTLDCDTVDVAALLTECAESAQPLVAAGVTLTLELDPTLQDQPAWRGDGVRLRQVVMNLLGNAAKFTTDGRIVLRAQRDPVWLTIAIEDTGIGIAAADLPRLFQEFEQVDASSTRRAGGTGLGLAICRKLCRLMGGEIAVQSVLGHGSRFTVRIPEGAAPGGSAACVNQPPPTSD